MDSALQLSRAQGCLLGQLAGDSLGSLVEFQTPDTIRSQYPHGVRHMENGGTWNTIAGQPTDDSEMALGLAHLLIEKGSYSPQAAKDEYVAWLKSEPFDLGFTVSAGLCGNPNYESQANGALMRISPLGIFGAGCEPSRVMEWARQDAEITHPDPLCIQANAVFAEGIAFALRTGCHASELYAYILSLAEEMDGPPLLTETIRIAADSPPDDYIRHQGWVVIALRNALYWLLSAQTPEEGIVETIMQGGDTDTNAAICGSLLGAVHGVEAFPSEWLTTLRNCRPRAGEARVRHPRPERYWPSNCIEISGRLLQAGRA